MTPLVLGTAGHVDHGKTALVRSLTGQETDRLAEERERGVSIDLGFAWYELAGRRLGVVDVPGHERFLRNMLAGAHGIDLVLFVVAADDGIMPQTVEHLDILHHLGVRHGIFVITKSDLVDEARLIEVEGDIEILALGSGLEGAPVVRASNLTGAGIDRLRDEIARLADSVPARRADGPFRLPIDRAFVLNGHGLVVTGTARGGSVRPGDTLVLQPAGLEVRARSVQVHGEPVSVASAGQRIAVNLTGGSATQAARGAVLVAPGLDRTTDRFDGRVQVRPGARPIRSFDDVRVHVGTRQSRGRVIVLEGQGAGASEEIAAGSSALCQIALDEPVLIAAGDRFILRNETANRTIGGGVILQPFADRHKRGEPRLTENLLALESGALPERLHALLSLLREFAGSPEVAGQALDRTVEQIRAAARAHPGVVALPDAARAEVLITTAKWDELAARIGEALGAYLRAHPSEPGMEIEALRSRLRVSIPPRLFRPIVDRLEGEGALVREDAVVRTPSHRASLHGNERDLAGRVRDAIESGGFTPPDLRQLGERFGATPPALQEVLRVLERERRVVRVAPDLWFSQQALDDAEGLLRGHLQTAAEITAAEFRTQLSSSRKFAIALLDHFDRTALTLRVGDARRLRR